MLGAAYGQAVQGPATVDELEYFNFLLRQLGSIHHHPNSKAAFEYNLVRQFGLSVPELAVLRAAGQEMEALLRQHKPIIQSIRPDASGRVSVADNLTLATLSAQHEQKVAALANRILNQVRLARCWGIAESRLQCDADCRAYLVRPTPDNPN